MRRGVEIDVPELGVGRSLPEARGRLLREFFLNACLLALAKRAGFEAMLLEELARCECALEIEAEPLA